MDTGNSSQWRSWAAQKGHIQNIENYELEALEKILKHLITCTKHVKDSPEFFNWQIGQAEDVSTLNQDECASFLSECGLLVILTVSLKDNEKVISWTFLTSRLVSTSFYNIRSFHVLKDVYHSSAYDN